MDKLLKNFLKTHLPISYQYLNKQSRLAHRLFIRPYVDKNSEISKILKNEWRNYKIDLYPNDRKMRVFDEINLVGMSTENIRFFINTIVGKFAKNSAYLEVGIFQGCSLLSAALFNSSTRCIGIDNFSNFDPNHENQHILKENLKKFPNLKNIEYYDKNYQGAIGELFAKEPDLKISVYYYDGSHDYENQLNGLRIMLPHLAKRCIILVDDINCECVEKANRVFISQNHDFRSVFRIKTYENATRTWWNGFEVISRGI